VERTKIVQETSKVPQQSRELTVVEDDSDIEMPHADIEAEASVLGSMVMASSEGALYDCRDEVIEIFGKFAPRAFYLPANQLIYDALVELHSSGQSTDPITLTDHLRKTGMLTRAGGPKKIMKVVSAAGTSPVGHAQIVLDMSRLRHMETALSLAHDLVREAEGEAEDVVAAIQQKIEEAAENFQDDNELETAADVLEQVIDGMETASQTGEAITGLRTGFPDLDEKLGGMRSGQVIVVAGTPGTGKTTLAQNFMRSVAVDQNEPTGMFSLEMPKKDVLLRILADVANVEINKLKSGVLTEAEWDLVREAQPRISQAPMYFDGSPDTTVDQMALRARMLVRRFGVKMIIIDHFHIIPQDVRKFGGNKVNAAEDTMNRIRIMARTLGVVVVLLAQLNRGANVDADTPPDLHDFKGTSAIEEGTHVALMMHRPDLYKADHTRAGEVDIHIVKNRDGALGVITLNAKLRFGRFGPMGSEASLPVANLPFERPASSELTLLPDDDDEESEF
jgi:replicative DNA helicase